MRSGTGMSAAAAAGVSQMSGLASDKQSAAAAAMQFPLTQRRKRRVLFTQAQVKQTYFKKAVFECILPLNLMSAGHYKSKTKSWKSKFENRALFKQVCFMLL